MKLSSTSEEVREFWNAFCAHIGENPSAKFYEATCFGDTEDVANEIAKLILAGEKRGSASLLWVYEHARQNPPRVGGLSVVTDWSGLPRCVIETTEMEVVPFDKVSADFVRVAGEGDKSLESWRHAHWNFFSSECAKIGREPSIYMDVVCERFAVVYRAEQREMPHEALPDRGA